MDGTPLRGFVNLLVKYTDILFSYQSPNLDLIIDLE